MIALSLALAVLLALTLIAYIRVDSHWADALRERDGARNQIRQANAEIDTLKSAIRQICQEAREAHAGYDRELKRHLRIEAIHLNNLRNANEDVARALRAKDIRDIEKGHRG